MNYEIIDNRKPYAPRRIDYARMSKEGPKVRQRVEAAAAMGDPVAVADAVIAATRLWEEVGAWPDDWHYAQRALDDVLPFRMSVSVADIAAGAVVIRRAAGSDDG